jgi:hypothetical protein
MSTESDQAHGGTRELIVPLAKGSFILLALCTAVLRTRLGHAQSVAFRRLNFEVELLIEVARHWMYLDENIRMKTSRESIAVPLWPAFVGALARVGL